MGEQLFDALKAEWTVLSTSRAARRALDKWQDPALAEFRDLDELVRTINQLGRPAESDRLLATLVRRASVDDLAARAALQAMMPGFRSVVRRYGWAADKSELASMTVASGFERIRCYPLHRRPRRIAANILADTQRTLYEHFVGRRITETPEPTLDARTFLSAEPTSTETLRAVVEEAVRRGVVSRSDARLIVETRIFDTPISALTERHGINAQSLRQRRLRAEGQMREIEVPLISP